MEEHLNFTPLLLVLLLAFIVPLLLGRVRWLPVVVGEIFAGILIGQSGLHLVGENATLEFMSNIGLAFLMFLAGLEIDFNRIFPARLNGNGKKTAKSSGKPNVLLLAFVIYVLTLALSVPGGFLLNRLGLEANPWLLAFILSATSLGVLLPILKQREMSRTPAGEAIFYSALIADFLTVILLTIFLITLQNGLDVEVFSIGLLFLAFFLAYRILSRFFAMRRVRALIEDLSHITVQIKVRGAIAILMTFVVLAGMLGVELILGAFLAGMIVSLLKTSEDTDLIQKLEAFGFGFFIPVFFIMVGATLDLRALAEEPQALLLIPLLMVVAIAVKTLPALLLRRVLPWRETLAGAALLNIHLSLEIAVAVIGARLGLISPAANVNIILFSALTVLLMPIIFNAIAPAKPSRLKRFMLLFGAEDLGLQVARVLKSHDEDICILEPDSRLVQKAQAEGFHTIQADTILDCIEEANQQGEIQAVMALTSDDTRNLLVSRAAQSKGVEHIVALVNDPARLINFRDMGVNTFTPAVHRPALLALMARNPDIFRLLTDSEDNRDVREIYLRNRQGGGKLLRSLNLPDDLLVLSIGRNGDLIIPHGNTRVEVGDRLTLLGSVDDLRAATVWLEGGLQALNAIPSHLKKL